MAYDPCAPTVVSVLAGKTGRAVRHHSVRHLLGRRVAHWPGPVPGIVTDACPKAGARGLPPSRLALLAPLTSPAVITAVGMGVVGASAFGGAAMLRGSNAPGVTVPRGPIILPGGGSVVQPPPGGVHTVTGAGGTSVPEPGTAAILAVAMVGVLISSWIQGGRAFRGTAESRIGRLPIKPRHREPVKSSIVNGEDTAQ